MLIDLLEARSLAAQVAGRLEQQGVGLAGEAHRQRAEGVQVERWHSDLALGPRVRGPRAHGHRGVPLPRRGPLDQIARAPLDCVQAHHVAFGAVIGVGPGLGVEHEHAAGRVRLMGVQVLNDEQFGGRPPQGCGPPKQVRASGVDVSLPIGRPAREQAGTRRSTTMPRRQVVHWRAGAEHAGTLGSGCSWSAHPSCRLRRGRPPRSRPWIPTAIPTEASSARGIPRGQSRAQTHKKTGSRARAHHGQRQLQRQRRPGALLLLAARVGCPAVGRIAAAWVGESGLLREVIDQVGANHPQARVDRVARHLERTSVLGGATLCSPQLQLAEHECMVAAMTAWNRLLVEWRCGFLRVVWHHSGAICGTTPLPFVAPPETPNPMSLLNNLSSCGAPCGTTWGIHVVKIGAPVWRVVWRGVWRGRVAPLGDVWRVAIRAGMW